jgi:hypothetical protein
MENEAYSALDSRRTHFGRTPARRASGGAGIGELLSKKWLATESAYVLAWRTV